MPHFRRRRRLRHKEIENIAKKLEEILGCDVFSINDTVDMAEGRDYDIVIVNGDILALMIDQKPFLSIRGFLKYKATKRFVTVDMGAVPYVCNGADVMAPGVVDADKDIKKDELVWIRDENNKKPLAIGAALISGEDMRKGDEGKAVKNIHYVGDKLWRLEE